MNKNKNFLDTFGGLFSSTAQLQRIVILSGVVLVLLAGSTVGYYFYDRYYTPEQSLAVEGIEAGEAAVREDPNNLDKRLALADTYLVNQKYEQAISLATSVLIIEQDNPRGLIILGIAYAKSNQPDLAIEPLQKFIELNKDADMPGLNKQLQSAAYYLGDSFIQLEQWGNAIVVLEQNYQWNKMDADTMVKLATAYAGNGNNEDALKLFHKATEFVPDFKEAYEGELSIFEATGQDALADYSKGMIAYCDNDFDKAKELLQKALEADSSQAPIYNGLGMVYEAVQDYENALIGYENALSIDPNYIPAKTGYGRITILLNK